MGLLHPPSSGPPNGGSCQIMEGLRRGGLPIYPARPVYPSIQPGPSTHLSSQAHLPIYPASQPTGTGDPEQHSPSPALGDAHLDFPLPFSCSPVFPTPIPVPRLQVPAQPSQFPGFSIQNL